MIEGEIRIILVATFLFNAPPAAACHRFSRWHYPWPQPCGLSTHAPRYVVSAPEPVFPPIRPDFMDDDEIPLPALSAADVRGCEADDLTRGRLLLHYLLGANR